MADSPALPHPRSHISLNMRNSVGGRKRFITGIARVPDGSTLRQELCYDQDYLELNASIVQPSLKRVTAGRPGSAITDANGNPKVAPVTWNWSVGWYHNTWRLNTDGSVCMTRFEAWTMSQHDFSATYVHDYILRADLL